MAQNTLPDQIRIRQTLDGLSDLGGLSQNDMLYGIDIEPGRLLGDYYLDSKWNKASLLLYESDRMIDGYYVKYDIEGNSVEVKLNRQIKLLQMNKIRSMIWYDSITKMPRAFVNAKDYSEKGSPLTGLLEIVVDGKLPLVKRTMIWIKRPDYVVAFDVGSKDTKINKKEIFYYLKGKEVFEIKKRKDLFEVFGDKRSEMEEFARVNKLNTKEERGLSNLFERYNSYFEEKDQ